MCITGMSSKDSLATWITFLEDINEKLTDKYQFCFDSTLLHKQNLTSVQKNKS